MFNTENRQISEKKMNGVRTEKAVQIGNEFWTSERIKLTMEQSDVALINGLIKIYNKQTEDEKSTEYTKYHNTVGFTGVDGNLSSFAQFYIRNKYLSPKQIKFVRKRMLKYSTQLFNMMVEQKIGKVVRIVKIK